MIQTTQKGIFLLKGMIPLPNRIWNKKGKAIVAKNKKALSISMMIKL